MIRFGVVVKVDADLCRVKVNFEEDEIESDWLPVAVQGSKENKYFHIFDLGEHVVCLMDENAENGVVLSAIYSSKEKPPAIAGDDVAAVEFKDGTQVIYDRNAHRLDVKMGSTEFAIDKLKGFTIKAGGQSFKQQLNDLFTQLQAETHPTPAGPSSPPINSPVYASIQALLNLIFEA